jgi:AGCS family alanine or glycine:cation symporter
MEFFHENIILPLDAFLWGALIPGTPIPGLLVILLIPAGLFLTFKYRGLQFRKIWAALKLGLITRKEKSTEAEGDISHFQALATGLAGTVGTGSIAGVATAIGVGGPGALFWMWVSAIFGMTLKYSEGFLGSKYREVDANGEQVGGPAVFLRKAIKNKFGKFLSVFFGIATIVACFGIGNMTQINSMTGATQNAFNWDPLIVGIIVMVLTGAVIIGGIQTMGKFSSIVVPSMILLYCVAGTVVLIFNAGNIGPAFGLVFQTAFTGQSAAGGFLGAGMALALQKGVARGLFATESGLGTASIMAASAESVHPVRQGLVSMTQTFIDGIIVVGFTGIVLVSSGAWYNGVDATGTLLEGANLTSWGFSQSVFAQAGTIIVTISLFLFAFTTIVGWAYYGERSVIDLLGKKFVIPFKVLFLLVIIVGAVTKLEIVWDFSDVANGLMAIPNILGILILSPMIAKETRDYLSHDPHLDHPLCAIDKLEKQNK